ncbi:MAG: coenzyme F420-0:L-glutamate ligase [Minisyncoccia bacterium]
MILELKPNPDKELIRNYNSVAYERLPIKTKTVMPEDNLEQIVNQAVLPHKQEGDILCISEKIVAITQGRAYHINDIHPSWFAKLLSKYVYKSNAGIGIGSPWTMELAIHEAGYVRIFFAAAVSAVTRPFGVRGLFYKVVGKHINAIDGPCDYTIAPFNKYAKLPPKNPNKVASKLETLIGIPVVIIDANDLGVNILGASNESINQEMICELFRDNPLGQKSESTPLCIVRKHEQTN